jgi:hypothetical protein
MGSLQWAKTDVFWYYEVVSCIGSCGLDKGGDIIQEWIQKANQCQYHYFSSSPVAPLRLLDR